MALVTGCRSRACIPLLLILDTVIIDEVTASGGKNSKRSPPQPEKVIFAASKTNWRGKTAVRMPCPVQSFNPAGKLRAKRAQLQTCSVISETGLPG